MLYIPIYCHCCLVISPDRRRHFGLPSRRPVSVADAAGAADLGVALSAGGEDEAQFSRHFGMMFGENPWGTSLGKTMESSLEVLGMIF